jgi:hypothetical protein
MAVEGGSRAVQGGWSAAGVQIQCFKLAQEGRQRDEALPEDEAEAASSS